LAISSVAHPDREQAAIRRRLHRRPFDQQTGGAMDRWRIGDDLVPGLKALYLLEFPTDELQAGPAIASSVRVFKCGAG